MPMPWFSRFFASLGWWLAQVPASPAPAPSPAPPTGETPVNLQLLQSQIEFLKDANTRLAASFQSFTTTINVSIVVLTLVLGVLGGVGLFLFGQTLKEAKQSIESLVRKEVERLISRSIQQRVENLENMLDREALIGRVTVDYLMVKDRQQALPLAYTLLCDRGFQVRLVYGLNNYSSGTDVTILELNEKGMPPDVISDALEHIKRQILSQSSSSHQPMLVIHINGQHPKVTEIAAATPYSIPANGPIKLVTAVADAAYVAYSLNSRR
jgi:hypothetical protein